MGTTIRFAAIFAVGACVAYSAAAESLSLIQTISLDGVTGRIDHMSVDRAAKRLYVAALGNNTVEVIDLASGKRIGAMKDLGEPQGIAVDPVTHGIVVASGADGMCRVYDLSLKQIGALANLDDADNVRFDTQSKLAYVGYGNGALAVLDPANATKIRETKLKGHPESFQIEKDGDRVFVNIPSAHQIAVVNKLTGNLLAEWPVTGAESNFPMALNEHDHRLFVGCRRPAKLLVFDTESGKSVASVDCCGDTDDVFWDAERMRIYVSGGEGCVTVLDMIDADHYKLATRVSTVAGARTSFFDHDNSRFYVAVPHHDSRAAEIRVYSVQR